MYLILSLTQVYDSIQVDIASGKIQDTIKFDSGNLCMVTGGRNTGRVGTIMSRERHPGSFDIVHVKDANGHTFATRINYVFIIGTRLLYTGSPSNFCFFRQRSISGQLSFLLSLLYIPCSFAIK